VSATFGYERQGGPRSSHPVPGAVCPIPRQRRAGAGLPHHSFPA